MSRLYPSRPFLAASVAVFRDGKVLLAARARPPAQHVYTLPGGIVEPGETLPQAALRELHEEVGVEADILGFNDHVEVIERDPDGRVRHHFVVASFVGRWLSGEGLAGPEAADVIWVQPEEIGHLPTTAGLPGVLRRAKLIADAAG